jgi:hypothetical protein
LSGLDQDGVEIVGISYYFLNSGAKAVMACSSLLLGTIHFDWQWLIKICQNQYNKTLAVDSKHALQLSR